MLTVTELARHWGTSHQYTSKRVKQGCPLDSFEVADFWRQANQVREPRKKMPTAPEVDLEPIPISPEGTLIPFAIARDMAWRGYGEILDLVLELPKRVAAQCNPSNPKLAFDVLESQCTGILCSACDVYSAWTKIGPFANSAGEKRAKRS